MNLQSSSIGSTNSVNSSVLNEIARYSTNSAQTKAGSSVAGSPPTDTAEVSQTASLFKELAGLHSTDPAEFKQVLTDAAAKFKEAAGKATDPEQAQFLKDLANRFQNAAESGNLSSLLSGPSNRGNNGLYTRNSQS